jgi:ATP-binding cassette subfamily B protein
VNQPVPEHDTDGEPLGTTSGVLRRGLAASPALRKGIGFTLGMALVVALGRILIPIMIQQTLQRGVLGPSGYQPVTVAALSAVTVLALIVVGALNRATYLRLVNAAETTLYELRCRVFDHVHRLSIGTQNESFRGVLVSRVTSDIETLAQFAQWGAISWIVNLTLVAATLVAIAVYSWQLCLVVVVIFAPVVPLLRVVQRLQVQAYDEVRNAVGGTLSEISEAVMGAAVIRAYGLGGSAKRTLHRAIRRQYRAQMRAAWYFALMFPISDLFGALAIGSVVGLGVWNQDAWGLQPDGLIAVVFLTGLILQPIGEIGEILDQTQTAIAGWRKVLSLLDVAVEVVEPADGESLPEGALAVRATGVGFHYGDGVGVLADVDLDIEAGTSVAIVGETGSGKTTFAKLLARLADPVSGSICIGDCDLRGVSEPSRASRIRMVPQDGFLFAGSVGHNIALGSPDATEDDVRVAIAALGLEKWVDSLELGLETEVGERGEKLSVGERQLVCLIRAQMGDAGLLILDEATSSIDPETERRCAQALELLSHGRTTVSIAHRLSTAEAADVVVVFDQGRICQVGSHEELLAERGVYRQLHESWVHNTTEPGVDPQT